MSDLELLFLVLLAIYGWECSCWLRRGSVGFVTWLGRHWRPAHPNALLGNTRGGIVLAPPFPPLGTFLQANQFPLSLSPEAVLVFVASSVNPAGRPPQSARLFRLDALKEITAEGKKVLANGEVLVRTSSPSYAAQVARVLAELIRTPQARRPVCLEALLHESFDRPALEGRWREYQKLAGRSRWWTNALFVVMFAVAPAVIWRFGVEHTWPLLLATVLMCTTATAWRFRRAHQVLFPEAGEERFTQFLILLLSPASTIRMRDVLTRPLLERFHPLAVAEFFCDAADFRELARAALLDLRYPAGPACPNPDPLAVRTERSWREALTRETEAWLKQKGVELEDLIRPPAPTDPTCLAYCPRCRAQFTTATGICSDCGGLPLIAFAVRT